MKLYSYPLSSGELSLFQSVIVRQVKANTERKKDFTTGLSQWKTPI